MSRPSISSVAKMTLAAVLLLSCPAQGQNHATAPVSPYKAWSNGPSADPAYFPIAVWLQDPKNAKRYKDAGFNLYVGLWNGPTEDELTTLRNAGMQVICDQNKVALNHLADKTIVGWMHGDEPDNAQELPGGKGYGPPIKPDVIVSAYKRIRAADPTRPVMLNLGQGVAWDAYIGRGVRSRHPEDYAEYARGGDIVSFDIYPVVHDSKEIAGNLWYVAQGVDRLRKWTDDKKVVWNCIECTHIDNPGAKATPQQVRSEAWMSIVHGSRGLIYFVHQFKPKFIEAAIFADAEMTKAVTEINAQVHELAPVINSPTVDGAVSVASSATDVPVDMMVKKQGNATYIFAVAMRPGKTGATFTVKGISAGAKAEVLGESRSVATKDGKFTDAFDSYAAHIYRIK